MTTSRPPSDPLRALAAGDAAALHLPGLRTYLPGRRWFAGGVPDDVVLTGLVPVDAAAPCAIALAEARFAGGAHATYQLLLGLRAYEAGPGGIDRLDHQEIYDAYADPRGLGPLIGRLGGGGDVTDHAELRFRPTGEAAFDADAPRRGVGAEQSNTAVVVGERVILKAYRRLEPGPHPELEVLQLLAARGFAHVPPLLGWYAFRGEAMDTVLGIAQAYRAGSVDGWRMTLDLLRDGDHDTALRRLHTLGTVVGDLHVALATDVDDPAAAEELGRDAVSIICATVDEQIRATLDDHGAPESLAPLRGCREDLLDLARGITTAGGLGRRIRIHGDLHLGQALWWEERWQIVDFEGEPDRPLNERRHTHSPLRDLAGLLRSVEYAHAAARRDGIDVPELWRRSARDAILDGYAAAAGTAGLLPTTPAATAELLALHELEKAVYELRYEIAHRPDWIDIPLGSLLEMIGR